MFSTSLKLKWSHWTPFLAMDMSTVTNNDLIPLRSRLAFVEPYCLVAATKPSIAVVVWDQHYSLATAVDFHRLVLDHSPNIVVVAEPQVYSDDIVANCQQTAHLLAFDFVNKNSIFHPELLNPLLLLLQLLTWMSCCNDRCYRSN